MREEPNINRENGANSQTPNDWEKIAKEVQFALPDNSVPAAEDLDRPLNNSEQKSNIEDDEQLKQIKDWYLRLADAKSKFDPMDGESAVDYERRMTTVVLSNIMSEMASHPERNLSDVEYAKVVDMYPRQEDEMVADWQKRIKDETNIDITRIDVKPASNNAEDGQQPVAQNEENVDDQPVAQTGENVDDQQSVTVDVSENSDAEQSSAETGTVEDTENKDDDGAESEEDKRRKFIAEQVRRTFRGDLFEPWLKARGFTGDDVKNLSDEDALTMYNAFQTQLTDFAKNELGLSDEDMDNLQGKKDEIGDLIRKYNEYLDKLDNPEDNTDDSESAEELEKLRAEMIRAFGGADLQGFLENEGMTLGEIRDMSIDELRDLQEKLRPLMMRGLGVKELSDYLERDDVKMGDLRDASFDEIREMREGYRVEFMREVGDKQYADKLEERNIKMGDLRRMTLEELIALKNSLQETKKVEAAPQDEDKSPKMPEALIAVINNRERDAHVAARALAEDMFKNRIEGNGKKFGKAVRNLIFGQMLKESTMMKYEREALAAIQNHENSVRGVDIANVWSYDRDGAGGKLVERLTLAYTNGIEDSLIHGAAGNEMTTFGVEYDENGNKVVYRYSEGGNKREAVGADSVEAQSTITIRDAIESFARGRMTEGDFREAMEREKANMLGEGVDTALSTDTLLETAIAARQRFNHEESIENVMAGFRLINADYSTQVRTEVHRSKIDEISERIAGRLHIFQPETIAAAAGVVAFVAQRGTTSAMRAAVPVVGGALAAGTFASFKEHNRVAVDRAEQMRRLARGESIGNAKYDRQMNETAYQMSSAENLTKNIKEALSSGDATSIAAALAEAEFRSRTSDERGIDLIRFSAGDSTTMEDERLALDVQIAQAKVALRERGMSDDTELYRRAVESVRNHIESDISAKDTAFKKLRAKRVAAQFTKTAAIGAGAAVVSQEVVAAFNPSSYGLFDKLNDTLDIRFKPLNIGVNNPDAHNTLIAGALGFTQPEIATSMVHVNAAEASDVKLSQKEIDDLRKEGYTVKEKKYYTYDKVESTQSIDAAEYARENGLSVSREWEGDLKSGLWRDSNGDLYSKVTADGRTNDVKMYLSLSRDSQMTPIVIDGKIDANGVITFPTDDPNLDEIMRSGKYAFAEVAYDTGTIGPNGGEHLHVFATHVGSNSVDNMFEKTTTEIIPKANTLYDVIGYDQQVEKIIQNERLTDTGVVLPFATRKNLTRGERGQRHGVRNEETLNYSGVNSFDNLHSVEYPVNRLASLTDGGGNRPTESEVSRMRSALNVWNGLTADERKRVAIGDYEVFADEAGAAKNFDLLKRFRLIDIPSDVVQQEAAKPEYSESAKWARMGEGVDNYVPIKGPEDPREINATLNSVRRLNPNINTDAEFKKIRQLIENWNSQSNAERVNVLNGNFNSEYNLVSQMTMALDLAKYNLIQRQPWMDNITLRRVDRNVEAA